MMEKGKIQAGLQILILVTAIFAFASLIEQVSAVTDIISTCEITNDGHRCVEFLNEDVEENCAGTIFPGPLKDFYNCELGCCYDEDEGTCSSGSPREECNSVGGVWSKNPSCNLPVCEGGCCILGNQGRFVTEQRCNKLSSFYGIDPDFRSEIGTELECILFTQKEDEGACIFEFEDGKKCIFTTREDCFTRSGKRDNFYKDFLCSHPDLNTSCERQDYKGCVEGKEGVYWFDSCDNPENIYDTNKEKSWNQGRVLSISESCGVNSRNGNINSKTCGNCDYREGSICGQKNEEYICKDLNCYNTKNGKDYKNGESWCIYEGTIGDGKDVAGSRHMKHSCFNGEEIVEPCADFRNEICVQNEDVFSEAVCRINRWRECLEINLEPDAQLKKEECEKNSDCKYGSIDVDASFKFNTCTSKYPPGFDVKKRPDDAKLVCGQASQRCKVIKTRGLFSSKWTNEDCTKEEFTIKMNDFCTSVGDCGGYVNVVGEYDQGFRVAGRGVNSLPRNIINQLKDYAKPNLNQKPADPGDFSIVAVAGEEGFEKEAVLIGGGIGSIIGSVNAIGFVSKLGEKLIMSKLGGKISSISNIIPGVDIPKEIKSIELAKGWAGFSNFLGATLGATAGTYVIMKLMGGGFPADASLIVASASSIGGGSAGISAASSALATGASGLNAFITAFVTAFIWAAIITSVLIGILKLFKIGESKEYTVEFRCQPWQAPIGGKDCGRCDEFERCSEYKCHSLGQTCELINRGTENEACVDKDPDDVTSPKISPFYEIISEGYEYDNVNENGFEIIKSSNKGCIDAFTQILFGVQIKDRPAQCRIGTEPMQSFSEMEDFGGNNLPLLNHTMGLSLPSPEAFGSQYNLSSGQISQISEVKFYVKCKSLNGIINPASYTIKTCVNPGPDLTAPMITNTNPVNNAFTRYDAAKENLKIWLNEPAECKWSKNDRDYNSMENSMVCETNLENVELYGWACNTSLDVNADNKFYIKCQDISENKNTMVESYVHELSLSTSELKIENVKPVNGEEIISGVEPVEIDLRVETSGGSEQGKAECFYRFSENNNYIRFFETYSNFHKQLFSSIIRGNYQIDLKCEDSAGNVATASTSFKVRVDNSGPKIVRMYYGGGGLKIVTNEPAECRYDFGKFIFNNATEMSGAGTEHIADWKFKTYKVQCEDEFGNKGNKISIKPYKLIS